MFLFIFFFFFFKQKTAYEMRISDWSSDVCSSDLRWVSRLRSTRTGMEDGWKTTETSRRPACPPRSGAALRRSRRRSRRSCRAPSRSEERRVGKSVSVRVDLGGRRIIKKKTRDSDNKKRHDHKDTKKD